MKILHGAAIVATALAVFGGWITLKALSSDHSAETISYMTLDEFAEALDSKGEVLLVEFCTPVGHPCCNKMRKPIEQLANTWHNQLTVRRVNLDRHLQLAWELKLPGAPSYVAFRDGEEVFRASHSTSADIFASELAGYLGEPENGQLALADR